jgi:tetratricopeptide (TPR) repeat protein
MIAENPSSPHAHGNYAAFLVGQDRNAEAAEYYEKAVELGPYPLAEYGLAKAKGYALHKQGKYKEAIAYFEKAVQYPMADQFVLSNLGVLYNNVKEYGKAKVLFKEIIKDYPDHFRPYAEMSLISKETGDWKACIDYGNKAIELKPDWSPPYFFLGFCHERIGDKEAALDFYRIYIEKDPDSLTTKQLKAMYPELN